MGKIKNNKKTVTVVLAMLVILVATTLFAVLFNTDGNTVQAYEINTNARNAVIGDHGVGEAEHLAPGQESDVRYRFGVGSDYSVVWVYTASELKQHLETASGAKSDAGVNKIIVLANDIDWDQSSMTSDVGSQKFVGILDGNGYKLNIVFSATLHSTGKIKGNKGGNDAYYKVTQSDIGSASNNFPADNGDGVRGVGLVVGVNAGTIANLTVNYSAADGAMRDGGTADSDGNIEDTNSLDSAESPDVPYGYGIVTGVNIGTIDNVYVNQQSIFNGNTKANYDKSSGMYAPGVAYKNCSSVGGIAGINMGYGVINNCYMYVGGQIWAQADGFTASSLGGEFSAAFAGGITGWIKGDNAQMTYCYIDGNADINAWAQRGDTKSLLTQNYAWSLAYAGGVTSGKLKFVELDNVYYVEPTAMGANQVKGIISNWTGSRRDSYGQDSYVDTTNTFGNSKRSYRGMPFDYLYSADQGSDKQDLIIFTFNYKEETGNDTLDMTHPLESASLSPAKMNSNWIEVYGWDHSLYTSAGDSEVSINFEGNYLRVQAKSKGFMENREIQLESVTRSDYPNGYRPTYDSSFQGCMIWGTDIYSIGADINPESEITSNVNKPTDKMGSYVQYYSSSMGKGTYVVKFGATYDYSIKKAITTSRQYNGQTISDMLPTLELTGVGGVVTPSDSCFTWKYSGAKAGAIEQSETIYPDTYYIQPCAIIDDTENSEYAYYDATQRTLAVNKGINSTVIITNATLSLSYTNTGWTKSASIPVTFSSNNSSNWNTTIIDAYSYQGGATTEIIPLSLTGTNNFTITETATTPRNGRTIYNVKAYVLKPDGVTYVEVADTVKADTDKKTATIKVDNSAPVLSLETYYLAEQFNGAGVAEIQQLLAENPENYTALDTAEVMSGRWYNENIIAVAEVSDENRSGVSQDTVGVQEAVVGGSLGNMNEDNYVTTVDGNGNARIVMLISGARTIQISVSDALGNFASFALNGGGFVNIDTTPITFSEVLDGQQFSVSYSFRLASGKAFSKLGVTFIPNFGGAGLSAWYYIDNNTTLGDDVMTPPEGVQWTKYEFDSTVVSGSENSILIPEGMENAAVFVMFTSGVEGYEVADPVIVRLVSNHPYSKFTVDLNGANITVNAQYVTVSKASTGESYNLAELVSGIDGVSLSEFFSKTYDGTNGAGKYSPDGTSYVDDITFSYTISDDVKPEKGQFWSGTFYANTEENNFRTSWLKFTMEYTEVNSGSCYLNLSLTTSDASPIDMSIAVAYDGNLDNGQKTFAIPATINRINMTFDIGQIFSEGQGVEMSKGSYTVGDNGSVTFNWIYGDIFDGLVATIVNDESGGTMSFRFNCLGKKGETFMNVGGVYSAYVDAIKIDSPMYQMDDFASLVQSGDSYVGDAGVNYTVSISGSIPINVSPREERLTFALDGAKEYSFNIPYDGSEHVVTAEYTDVEGNVQYAAITWKNASGSDTTLTSIKDIGTYTAVAKITDPNYTLITDGQYRQTFSILATYLDVSVPDKTVQYNDGGALKYIPDLDEKYPDEIRNNVVFTITYYEKLGSGSLKVMKNPDGTLVDHVTEVGEYYVSVVFDPERKENKAVEELTKFARKEYTRAESGTQGGDEQYILFTVTKADTEVSGVTDQTKIYNKMPQMIDWNGAKVLSQSTKKDLGASVRLQYWDENSESYVDFDSASNNGKYLDVGQYSYRLVYDGDVNYNASTLNLTLTINSATISGVVFGGELEGETVSGLKVVYDGKKYKLEADISGSNLVGEDDVVIEYGRGLLYSKTAPEYTIVGRYEVKLRITCPNYETYETSSYVIITTAPYPEKENPITFVNGQDVEVEYNGEMQSVEYTLNKEKFSTITVSGELKATDVGVYDGEIMVMISNYESKTYEVTLTITAPKITSIDTSVIKEIESQEGLTSDTDLMRLEATFEGVDGKPVQAELIFKNAEGVIVTPDAYGCLPAGEYSVTFEADNYDLSGVGSYNLTLAQGSGNRDCDHEDKNGDGICELCGKAMSVTEDCPHVDEDGDGKCDLCGASIGNVTQPKDAPDVIVIVVVVVCALLIVASVAGVVVAAVKRSKKKNNRYNII